MVNNKNSGSKAGFLLFSLVLLMVLFPFLEGGVVRYAILNLLISIVLITGVYAASYNRGHFIGALIFGIPALIASWLPLFIDTPVVQVLSVIVPLPFYLYTTITLFFHILRSSRISSEQIYASISVYLLLGITWAFLYTILERVNPGSFFLAEVQNIDGVLNGSDLLYYSFVTLTTTGYGDVTPVTTYARTLAVLESTIGVFYVAILISRLVSTYKPPKE